MTRPHAIEALFRTEATPLKRFLRRFGSSISSEDIAQESFAKLCALDQTSIIEPRAYLFQTARNLALNAIRQQKRSPIRSVPDFEVIAAPASGPSPEEQVGATQDLALINLALARLPERQRVALLLFRVEGWSQREIGAHLGVSHRTVERYIADAMTHCHLALVAR